jgi:hypothetical protein
MGIVTARDFTHDPAGGLDCNKLAAALTASGDPRIKYIIWNRRIWNAIRGWVAYNGTNPHDKHLHLSVSSDPARFDSTTPWARISAPAPEPEPRPKDPDMALLIQKKSDGSIHVLTGDRTIPVRNIDDYGALSKVLPMASGLSDQMWNDIMANTKAEGPEASGPPAA